MIVPEKCLPLLAEQRTHYKQNPGEEYAAELERTYEQIRPYLPKGDRILDIGCGMAGIDVFLWWHYGIASLTLLDKEGVSPVINAGWHENAETFSHYHSFDAAKELLNANGVDLSCVRCVSDIPPREEFDVVVSLLSWGFHYPIELYRPYVSRGGIIVADIRRGTHGARKLLEYGMSVHVIHEAQKYQRVLVKC